MARKTRRRVAAIVAACVACIAAGTHAAVVRYDADELGPRHAAATPPALRDGELRVVTINAWRLRTAARVPALHDAAATLAADLASSEARAPELLGLQEVQTQAAADAIARSFEADGATVVTCACGARDDGTFPEANVAVVRPPLAVESSECIQLGAMFPDHPRCAVLVRAHDAHERQVDFAVTHLAWHPDNAPQAALLRRELRARHALGPRTVIAGDFNAGPASASLHALQAAPLRDARPGAARTHFAGGRIDYVLAGAAFDVERGLDRRRTFDEVHPAARLTMPRACDERGPPDCAVSDHIPEGVVLRVR